MTAWVFDERSLDVPVVRDTVYHQGMWHVVAWTLGERWALGCDNLLQTYGRTARVATRTRRTPTCLGCVARVR